MYIEPETFDLLIIFSSFHFIRVQALLDWLGDTARVAAWKHSHFHRTPRTLSPAEAGLLNPAPAHVHAVATIVWTSHQQGNTYDVASLLTNELFRYM